MNDLVAALEEFWPHLLLILYIVVGVPAAAHVVLTKRDVRAAIGWAGLIWLTPLVGALLYVLLGVNRIQRTAVNLRSDLTPPQQPHADTVTSDESIWQIYETGHGHFATLEELTSRLTHRPLVAGNHIEPLAGGDLAYPAMLQAIDEAQQSVALASYIFDNDEVGRMFVEALTGAVERGVEVRVLIDSVGARYSRPSIVGVLRSAGVRVARFLPSLTPTMIRFFNLRNHRKILVADGKVGFTGGMNIRVGHMLSRSPKHPVADLHFRLAGPVVGHLQEAFAIDWRFTTDELLEGPQWFPRVDECGSMLARGISDGPDDDMDSLRLVFMGALACARRRVVIVTPYFLPEMPMLDVLSVCAMRGVEVDIVLPRVNNLAFVHWAAMANMHPMLERGVRVWLTPPPFDHSKLMVVDQAWCCFGSTNWDPRSLRLNFEFNVECYDQQLASQLAEMAEEKISQAQRLTLSDLDRRSLPLKLRDGVTRLFLPYL